MVCLEACKIHIGSGGVKYPTKSPDVKRAISTCSKPK